MSFKLLLPAIIIVATALPAFGKGQFVTNQAKFLADDDSLNLYCLRLYYPHIQGKIRRGNKEYLQLDDSRLLLYRNDAPTYGLDVDIFQSLALPYPLEPDRTTPKNSPGRLRNYGLLKGIYGGNAQTVASQLKTVNFMGKKLRLSRPAAQALEQAMKDLLDYAQTLEQKAWLKPDGAFYWRKIAGENVLSAHSFGIAIDFGAKKAPYWRWSKQMPHPLQGNYPSEIVNAMEKQGFIWGGKWREYDLMHFEYRPELICKARMRSAQQ